MSARSALTTGQLQEKAPSIYAKKAAITMSENYTFVPTHQAIETLKKIGLVPVDASQRKSKGDPTTARHLVRFAFLKEMLKTHKPGDWMTELVLVNSHNGRSAFKMYYGLFLFLCGNGLIVPEATVGMVRRHIGDVEEILDEVDNLLNQGGSVIKIVKNMRNAKLTDPQRHTFAEKALALRYAEEDGDKVIVNTTILPDQLLLPRRIEDKGNDLWRTFNVVQENLINGGLQGKSAQGRVTRTRQLHDVRKLVSVNTDLWGLAQDTLKLAA